ncbi:helix-turn-helix transcriptional regulator [Kutzneria albida]|uniref:HTH luxR-type domain-containing protein n=1 Tax=Kutzneria albida DSM 43870 TaxID=1449976 RepID=W5WM91_9PSEU|nr:helix-turn-helix transcriptional regulator [Kutzneria albida]AHH99289.1 hypothetical protein KALB_5928 [Kutzneria albida DSM 43870]
MLDALDPDSAQGQVYRALVSSPRSRVAELAARTGLAGDAVRASLAELSAEGAVLVVDPQAEVWDAQSPAEVTEALLQREAARRVGVRRTGIELERLFRTARQDSGSYPALEVVEGGERILATLQRLQSGARRSVRGIDRPPYYGSTGYYADQEVIQRERMAAGIAYHFLYYESACSDPVVGPNMARMIEAGEQARTLAEPPMKLHIGDEDLAVVTLETEDRSDFVALVVRPSALLTTLCQVFDTLWKLAVPVSVADTGAEIDRRDRGILVLMASGATDEAIARRLDLSRRTVVRRVAALLEQLGATNRFQAGVQAARRGWL